MFNIIPVTIDKVVIVLGATGTGKSTLINMLYNDSSAAEEMKYPCIVGGTSLSVTKETKWHFKNSTCYADTVGFGDPDLSDFQLAFNLKKFVNAAKIGVHGIIITMRHGRLTKEERCNLQLISTIFEKSWQKQCMIVVSHYEGPLSDDGLVDETIKNEQLNAWLPDDLDLQAFIASTGYNVVFANNCSSNKTFELAFRPLRAQCLAAVKQFIGGCGEWIHPSPIDLYELILSILERIFNFYKLKRATERALNVITLLAASNTFGGECSICMEDIPFSALALTDCNHTFHLDCLKRLFDIKGNECPMCRRRIEDVSTPFVDTNSELATLVFDGN